MRNLLHRMVQLKGGGGGCVCVLHMRELPIKLPRLNKQTIFTYFIIIIHQVSVSTK